MRGVLGPLSSIGLGTAPLGSRPDGPLWWGPQDVEQSVETVVAAVDAGIDWIDTAPFYGWGDAERIVGRALSIVRHRVRILTKCGTVRSEDGAAVEDASPGSIRRGVTESLERLGLDRVDVVQIHDVDQSTPIEQTWAALMQLADEGLIGGAGLSNHSIDLMERALSVGPIATVQHQYSLLWRAPEDDGVLAWCDARSIPFLAWSPLASGFLATGFDLDQLDPSDLRRDLRWARAGESARLATLRGELAAIARGHGASATAVALAWVTRAGHHAIVGARNAGEAREAAQLAELTDDDIDRLDRASRA